jgi:hypothetical protein
MNVHHSMTYLKNADFNQLYFCVAITGASFGQSAYFKFATFGYIFQVCYFWVHFSKITLNSTSKSYMTCTTQAALLLITE